MQLSSVSGLHGLQLSFVYMVPCQNMAKLLQLLIPLKMDQETDFWKVCSLLPSALSGLRTDELGDMAMSDRDLKGRECSLS